MYSKITTFLLVAIPAILAQPTEGDGAVRAPYTEKVRRDDTACPAGGSYTLKKDDCKAAVQAAIPPPAGSTLGGFETTIGTCKVQIPRASQAMPKATLSSDGQGLLDGDNCCNGDGYCQPINGIVGSNKIWVKYTAP